MPSYPDQTSLSGLLSEVKLLGQTFQTLDNIEDIKFQDTFSILKEKSNFEFNETELLFVLDFTTKFNYSLYKSNIITRENRIFSQEVETIINYQFNNLKFVEYAVHILARCCLPQEPGCRDCGTTGQKILEALEFNNSNTILELLKSAEISEAFSEENQISENQWKSYRYTMESIWQEST